MKSPFPGMDPYLECHWGDVHTRLVTYGSDQLRPQLPAGLHARVQEHVTVEAENGMEQAPQTLRSIRIIDRQSGNRVVTAIEVLSHANKCGEKGRFAYRKKQRDLLAGEVNLVEIDLLREGHNVMAVPAHVVPHTYQEPYRICLVRASHPGRAEVYLASLRERLPVIPIPLRPADSDAILDMQAVIDQSYEDGGYGDDIDYRSEPQPPLGRADAEWADALLREKERR